MINLQYPKVFEDDVKGREYGNQILRDGYVALPHFLTPSFFTEVEKFAERVCHGEVTVSKSDKDTPMMQLAHSPECMRMFDAVYRLRCEAEGKPCTPLDPGRQRGGMPHMDAADGRAAKRTEFHYDGAYVNAIIGVIEPPAGQGALHLFPNLRSKFKNVFVGKVAARILRHLRFIRQLAGGVHIRPEKNVLYLFFGDRSFHVVEPITSGRRAVITLNSHW